MMMLMFLPIIAAAPAAGPAAPLVLAGAGIAAGLGWLFHRKKKQPALAPGQTPGINPGATTPSAAGAAGVRNLAGLSPQEIALLGLSAAGGALSNRAQTSTSTTTPVESPEYAPLGAALRAQVLQRLSSPVSLDGYESNGIQTINETYGGIAQALQNRLTNRGLGTSPVAAAAEKDLELKRGGDIATFSNGIPLLRRDLQNQDIAQAMQLYNAGRGTSSTSRSGGNVLGGAFSDTATALGYLIRQRQLRQQQAAA